MSSTVENQWALILGGSSGLGLATAKKLAHHGFNLLIFHRDRKSDIESIESQFQEITSSGVQLKNFNIDIANAEKRIDAISNIETILGDRGKVKIMVHSIAKGNLKPMHIPSTQVQPLNETKSQQRLSKYTSAVSPQKAKTYGQQRSGSRNILNNQDFQVTLNAMALSLYDWTKVLVEAGLFDTDARIVSFTSEGSYQAWSGYAAVSAAKATLEALTRSIALEFAPTGIKANCIQSGATETRAFEMIPGHERIKAEALRRNPNNRLTTPEDVANVVYLLTTDEARWITGTVIKVDGGESLQ